jgi:hypothetical protein
MRLTDLGRELTSIEQTSKTDFRQLVARLAISVLKKYQLKYPADEERRRRPETVPCYLLLGEFYCYG